MSFTCLKWSRSNMIAVSGDFDRPAWATMRFKVSPTERWLARPVRASVAARRSAIARLRRLAITAGGGHAHLQILGLVGARRFGHLHDDGADHLAADDRRKAR